jgi:hypothetical protein
MEPKKNIDFYGDQTRWFTGVVKSLDDPLQVARIQVRIHGIHSDSQIDIPDENLPWAQVVAPINAGGTSGLGNPLGIQVGALVFGIFLDGQHSQLPLVLGSIPKLEGQERDTPSVNALARGTNTVSHTPDPDTNEPALPYAAEYPYNKVYQTESGNTIEIDDTPGAIRIHIRHASGTFVEMHPNGDVVTHTKNGFKTVTGNEKIHVTGNMEIYADGDIKLQATGNVDIDGARIDLN